MTQRPLYLAYGSNLLPARLTERVGSAQLIGVGHVTGRRLAFHKRGADGSGKCDAPPAEGTGQRVHGALYRLDDRGWEELDRIEGVGHGYIRLEVPVETESGVVPALAYLAQPEFVDDSLAPFHWYKALVLEGARYHRLPADYIGSIADVVSFPDPDQNRSINNLGIIIGSDG